MKTLRIAVQTLGCKLNQLETESIADAFSRAGATIVAFHDSADLYVVNTCTVTSKAEQKARHDIRAALSRSPNAVVIVTGCYAQMEPDELASLNEHIVVVPGLRKASLLSLATWLSENWNDYEGLIVAVQAWQREQEQSAQSDSKSLQKLTTDARFAFNPQYFLMHSRPSLKIQDGCNNRCAFCRVCLARGPSVSLAPSEVRARVQQLEEAGKAEVVLTGVNLAQYRAGGFNFAGLLDFLLKKNKQHTISHLEL